MAEIPINIAAHVGHTPIVRLTRVLDGAAEGVELYAKLEALNPGGSVKDRIGVAMIDAAEAEGRIEPGRTTIVEATSGNTGIALAFVCAAKGYDLVLTLPQGMSRERSGLLRLYGAEVQEVESLGGMDEAVEAARAMARRDDVFLPDQFSNPANPEIHRRTTAPEILEALDGRVDVFVAGVGTGGTITGVGEVLKESRREHARRRRSSRRLARALRRGAGTAQDPGHRRGLRARGAQPRRDRRGDRGRRRGRDRDRATAGAARGRARRDLLRSGASTRRSRWRGAPSRRAGGSSRSCPTPASATSRRRSSRLRRTARIRLATL